MSIHAVITEHFQPFAVSAAERYSELTVSGSYAVFVKCVRTPKYWMWSAFVNGAQYHSSLNTCFTKSSPRQVSISLTTYLETIDAGKATISDIEMWSRDVTTEELDLLKRCLGPKSSEHNKTFKNFYIDNPASGLNDTWDRLEHTFNSPEHTCNSCQRQETAVGERPPIKAELNFFFNFLGPSAP